MIFVYKNILTKCLFNLIRNFFYCIRNAKLVVHDNVSISKSSFGSNVTLHSGVTIFNTFINDCTYIAVNTKVANSTLGKFCSIGPNCLIGPGRHPSSTFVSTHPSFYSTLYQNNFSFVKQKKFEEFLPIVIGHDVWIGANSVVMDGIKIGNGCIIGANSIVTKDVPDYAIVGGVPAKIIRYRFNQDIIQKLQKIQWWDWSLNKIKQEAHFFDNIENFLKENY